MTTQMKVVFLAQDFDEQSSVEHNETVTIDGVELFERDIVNAFLNVFPHYPHTVDLEMECVDSKKWMNFSSLSKVAMGKALTCGSIKVRAVDLSANKSASTNAAVRDSNAMVVDDDANVESAVATNSHTLMEGVRAVQKESSSSSGNGWGSGGNNPPGTASSQGSWGAATNPERENQMSGWNVAGSIATENNVNSSFGGGGSSNANPSRDRSSSRPAPAAPSQSNGATNASDGGWGGNGGGGASTGGGWGGNTKSSFSNRDGGWGDAAQSSRNDVVHDKPGEEQQRQSSSEWQGASSIRDSAPANDSGSGWNSGSRAAPAESSSGGGYGYGGGNNRGGRSNGDREDRGGYGGSRRDDQQRSSGYGGDREQQRSSSGYGGGYGGRDEKPATDSGFSSVRNSPATDRNSYGDQDRNAYGNSEPREERGSYGGRGGGRGGYGDREQSSRGGYGGDREQSSRGAYGGGSGYGNTSGGGYGGNEQSNGGYGSSEPQPSGYGQSSGYGDNSAGGYGAGGDREERGGYGGGGDDRGGRGDRDGPMLSSIEERYGRELPQAYNPRFDLNRDPNDLKNDLFGDQVTSGINFSKYDNIPIKVSGRDAPRPITSFAECQFSPEIIENIRLSGYTAPTPVQKHGIPALLSGRDLMTCAQTGSGKTAAFMLPIVAQMQKLNIRVSKDVHMVRPAALILAPTRELACQIYDEARKFTYGIHDLNAAVAYGGSTHRNFGYRQGCDILVATPGRLIDLIEKQIIGMSNVRFLVLDEADRILDMGFEPQIRKIIDGTSMPAPVNRQTFMFSATFPPTIQQMATQFMKDDYLYLTVGRVGSACDNITQIVEEVSRREKKSKLVRLLTESGRQRVLIFVNTKKEADFVDDFLFGKGFPATSIHGDRNQQQRELALASFRKGKTPILVATNVAARGLDIPDVHLVVIYDMCKDIEDYIHRIGRTARAGNTGKAVVFFDPSSDMIGEDLAKVLESTNQTVPDFLRNGGGGGGGYMTGGGYGDRGSNRDMRYSNNNGGGGSGW